MEQEATYVGIDVAKSRVDVGTRPAGEVWHVDYDEAGIASLVSALASASPSVVVVNPRQVRYFAKATGKLAKTDALDSGVLSQFAEAVSPALRPLRDADTQNLNELTTRRNQLMTMLVAEKNRLGWGTGVVHPRIGAYITWLEKELKDRDKRHCFAVRSGVRGTICPARFPWWVSRSQCPSWHIRRTGRTGPQADSGSRRGGPHQPGQRNCSSQAHCMGRPVAGEGDALHGNTGSHSLQLCDPGFLPETPCGKQNQENCTRRLHAQAADHTQQQGEVRSVLGPSNDFILACKTVAIASPLTRIDGGSIVGRALGALPTSAGCRLLCPISPRS